MPSITTNPVQTQNKNVVPPPLTAADKKNLNKSKVSVCFIQEIETAADSKSVRAAYAAIRKDIVTFANAITRDPNVVITHSVVSPDPRDMKPVASQPANGKIAELQSIKTEVSAKELSKAIPVPDTDEDLDPPRVVSGTTYQPAVVTSDVTAADVVATVDNIFKDIKRMEKSVAIVGYLATKPNLEVTAEDIVTGSKCNLAGVRSWIAQTGKSIKAFKVVRRGVYKFEVKKG